MAEQLGGRITSLTIRLVCGEKFIRRLLEVGRTYGMNIVDCIGR